MITRQTLQETKKRVKEAGDFWSPGQKEVVLTLIASNLQALDVIDGGMDAKERERQISLGLADLRTAVQNLAITANDSMHPEYGTKALFVLSMVEQMVRAKGTAWMRKWDWYQPRIEEEFGE